MHAHDQQWSRNTLYWEHMWSLTNLIKPNKISGPMGSPIFRRFLCVFYLKGLHRGTSKLRYSKCLKNINQVGSIPFSSNSYFSTFPNRVQYLKILFHSVSKRSLFPLHLITKTIDVHSLLRAEVMIFQQTKIWWQTAEAKRIYAWHLIISTSNTLLEVHLLLPCIPLIKVTSAKNYFLPAHSP